MFTSCGLRTAVVSILLKQEENMKTLQKIKFEWPIMPKALLKLTYFVVTSFCCTVTALADAAGTTAFFGILTVVIFITPFDDDDEEES